MRNIKPKYYLNNQGEFVIENYNHAKPFADFFPGIAGKYGIPMWVFFVNRGQAISSFGTKDKDHAILEFHPANKSWQLTSLQGFRTFIKVVSAKKSLFYEPFHNGFTNLSFNLTNKMFISSSDLRLQEDNLSLGLQIKVEYFTIPNDSYAALARIVTIKNTGKSVKRIQLIDGLPQIIPFGINNFFIKELSRTLEAWMRVDNLEKGAPFYRLAVDPADKPEVTHINEGNFYVGFHYKNSKPQIIKPIIDPQHVFGPNTDFSIPYRFISKKDFQTPKIQISQSKTPSALMFIDEKINSCEEKTFCSLTGYLRDKKTLNALVPRIIQPGYLAERQIENKKIIAELQNNIHTTSSSVEFDLYTKQTYLDNILRGGYPVTFPHPSGAKEPNVFYLYSRKHGDLERDYNRFQIQPSYLSQGNGNYRDMNQNRRLDVWFNPDVKEENVITFFNLLQLDGFNPLVVKGVSFSLSNRDGLKSELKNLANQKDIDMILEFLSKPFTPGELVLFIQENKIAIKCSYDEFLGIAFSNSVKNQEAEHGEGFWTDHWTYNLDLLENYLNVYPEKLEEIVFNKKIFTYFDNAEVVKPRHEKYLLYNGLPRQLHSITLNNQKRDLIKKRTAQPHVVRSGFGEGEIYQTTLLNKLICLVLNKISSLDPFGVGVEMEANKPNWYDALNGLPALLGSSVHETFELKRMLIFIKNAITQVSPQNLCITEEAYDFLVNIAKIIQEYFDSDALDKDFKYWDNSAAIKESYRQKTLLGVSGKEIQISNQGLISFLDAAIKKTDLGIQKAFDNKSNIYHSYFINEVAEYVSLIPPFIRPKRFIQKILPFFLEAQVHALRLIDSLDKSKALYKSVAKSQLYDTGLGMYKVTASLKQMPEEIGRCRVFSPGWLENESIWLHMEYKYLLEILKNGLYEEFYKDFKTILVPFQKPQRYGRSILENSSFIVSSAFVDKSLHGNGFVARLSGSTAEFLQIWLIMNIGNQAFFLNNKKELNLRFSPKLAGWLFNKKNKAYSFTFLSKILVVYHNPKMSSTFGKAPVKPQKINFTDRSAQLVEIKSDIIPSPYAEQVRRRQIKRIDITLG
ncbi:MAG: cellobiose phosphorylase [Candidatus Omnitrophota bacterium]